jgi:N-acetylglutamate synthase-like GNAT family acetyltransferase
MIIIKPYERLYRDAIVQMILHIQQVEFGVPLTIADQPDLLDIENFYQVKGGNFWIALNNDYEVVGTIALIDNDEAYGTVRKMFVRADYRGKEKRVAMFLFGKLEQQARDNGMHALYLGTVEILKASHGFYKKNGFEQIDKKLLPQNFPLMKVDTMFFRKIF